MIPALRRARPARPVQQSRSVTFRLPAGLVHRINRAVRASGTNKSEFLRRHLERTLPNSRPGT